jgi:fucose permease
MARLSRSWTLALVCGLYTGAGIGLSSVGPSLPGLAENIGRDVTAVGAQFTAFSLGTVVVQLVAATLGRRFGQRAILGVGSLLLGVGLLGESLSGNLVSLLALALLGGLGFGCVLAAGVLLVARLFTERSTSVLNLVNVFFGVGSIIGPLVAGAARARFDAPQVAMMLGALVLLALGPCMYWAAEQGVNGTAHGEIAAAAPPPWGLVGLLGLLLAAYSGTEIAVGGWAALYLEGSTSLATAQVALAVSGFWLALTAGRVIGAVLGLRLSAPALLGLALALMAVAAGLLLLGVGNAWISVLALAIFGLGCGPIFPTTMALVAASSQGRGAATNLALAIGNLGAGIIPPLLGVVLSESGPRAGATLVLCAVGAMVALLSLVALVHGRRSRSAAAQ